MSQTRILCKKCSHPQVWCQCVLPVTNIPDTPVFTCTWPERAIECHQRGEMIGMLMSVRFLVDAETRKKIEEFLAGVKD